MRRITDVRLPAPLGSDRERRHWVDLNDDGCIVAIQPQVEAEQRHGTNWHGDWLSPRGIDLQINGGLGLAFPELVDQDLPRLIALRPASLLGAEESAGTRTLS